MPKHKKYELNQADGKTLAKADTLVDFIRAVFVVEVPLIEDASVYVNRVFVASGKELNELCSWIVFGEDGLEIVGSSEKYVG